MKYLLAEVAGAQIRSTKAASFTDPPHEVGSALREGLAFDNGGPARFHGAKCSVRQRHREDGSSLRRPPF